MRTRTAGFGVIATSLALAACGQSIEETVSKHEGRTVENCRKSALSDIGSDYDEAYNCQYKGSTDGVAVFMKDGEVTGSTPPPP